MPRDIPVGNGALLSGNDAGDTAAFDQASGGFVHYKGARYFLGSNDWLGRLFAQMCNDIHDASMTA